MESENNQLLDSADRHVIEPSKLFIPDCPETLTPSIALAASDEIRNVEITVEHENIDEPSEYPPLKPPETFTPGDRDDVVEKPGKQIAYFKHRTEIVPTSIASHEFRIVENQTATAGDRRRDTIGSVDQEPSKSLVIYGHL